MPSNVTHIFNVEDCMEDIAGLCSKIALNAEISRIHVCDLVELRDMINDLRKHVAKNGYKTTPWLISKAADKWKDKE